MSIDRFSQEPEAKGGTLVDTVTRELRFFKPSTGSYPCSPYRPMYGLQNEIKASPRMESAPKGVN